MSEEPLDLVALRKRLEEEESAYASVLAAMDRLASFALPQEELPDLPRQMERLNALWEAPPPPEAGGITGRHQRSVWRVMAPALQRQQEFNSVLVQVLNGYVAQTARLHAHLREVVAALVRYLQRVLPVMDARDRLSSALATTRAELVLEAFDRRQESLGRRLEGLLALRDRVEAASEELGAIRRTLEAGAPPPPVAAAAARAAEDATYTAFENRYRGSREEIRERLASYLPLFEGLAPVVDLGCGRGEFLDLLREKGVAARGVESNAHVARECRERGLDVAEGDLVAFLKQHADGSLGGVFAAQVAEHLPPSVLQAMIREAHRGLRAGGLLVLETVNPRSVVGFLEVYNRDLTHERPLHPDTLSFLAAAAGFADVRVEYRAPVDAASRLQPVPSDGLPERTAQALNENVARLNGLLYGPQEYALLARR
ncbi:MAG: methyltransferase domain-containing protein [Acidobacteria bacterium]|nr:methyltransferase domain-containing protein [Acidobacteriota bacterium]